VKICHVLLKIDVVPECTDFHRSIQRKYDTMERIEEMKKITNWILFPDIKSQVIM
jgi:hypothetical protein